MSGVTLDIPLFPLHAVLFPGGFLPLRIFESRYLDMVTSCMQQQTPFGVVLIREGRETGPAADPFDTGTLAAIVDFDQSAEGLLLISCIGGDRFRILDRRHESNQLQRAMIEVVPNEQDRVLPPEYESLAEFLRAVVNRPGISRRIAPPDIDYNSPIEIGFRLAELLPVGVEEQQQLLSLRDPLERLARIADLLKEMDFTFAA